MASLGLCFSCEGFQVRKKIMKKFVCFSGVNVNSISLIVRPGQDPKGVEEKFNLFHACFSFTELPLSISSAGVFILFFI